LVTEMSGVWRHECRPTGMTLREESSRGCDEPGFNLTGPDLLQRPFES